MGQEQERGQWERSGPSKLKVRHLRFWLWQSKLGEATNQAQPQVTPIRASHSIQYNLKVLYIVIVVLITPPVPVSHFIDRQHQSRSCGSNYSLKEGTRLPCLAGTQQLGQLQGHPMIRYLWPYWHGNLHPTLGFPFSFRKPCQPLMESWNAGLLSGADATRLNFPPSPSLL